MAQTKSFISILDFIFPRSCLVCGKQGVICCDECAKKLSPPKLRCLSCNAMNPFGLYCTKCRRRVHPDRIFAQFDFSGPVREAIHRFKYQDAFKVGELLSSFLADRLSGFKDLSDYTVVAVPLSRKRRAWRGYNQAEIIAKKIAAKLNINNYDLLERKENEDLIAAVLNLGNNTQAKSHSRKERKVNVMGVFRLRKKFPSVPPKIILVDDVITTGATIEEATKVLKRAGAKEVVAVALAMT